MSVSGTRHPHRTTMGTVLVLVELACLALSAPSLHMAVNVMSNLIGVHDNSAINYSIFAIMFGTPGVLLLAIAVALRTRSRLPAVSPQRSTWSPGRRLATLRPGEWAWSATVMAAATVVWLLYLHGLA